MIIIIILTIIIITAILYYVFLFAKHYKLFHMYHLTRSPQQLFELSSICQIATDEEIKSQTGLVVCPGLQLLNIRTRILTLFLLCSIIHVTYLVSFILIKLTFRTIVMNDLIYYQLSINIFFSYFGLTYTSKAKYLIKMISHQIYYLIQWSIPLYSFFTRSKLF